MKRGKFITIEGIDGSGKSTLIERLKKHYGICNEQTDYINAQENNSRKFMFLVEPGGTRVSDQIRHILLSPQNTVSPITESLLFAASRAQLVSEVILKALEDGTNIICDRYIDSSFAYQGFARDLGLEFVQSINTVALGCMPDVTIFLDIDSSEAYRRKLDKVSQTENGELDRIESEKQGFQQDVYNGYKQLLTLYKDRIIAIDGTKNVEEKFSELIEIIENELQK